MALPATISPNYSISEEKGLRSKPKSSIKNIDVYREIARIQYEYNSAWQASRQEHEMIMACWKIYFGAIGEQWDEDALRYKSQKNYQRAAQYNIVGPKVRTFTGSLIADEWDLRFDPIEAERSSGVEAIENGYYTDKETCSYDKHFRKVIQDGVIHHGALEVVVNQKYGPRGNIWFRRCQPGSVMFDPAWTSDDDRDCLKAWKRKMMTLPQMEAFYQDLPNSPEVDHEREKIKKYGQEWLQRRMEEVVQPYPCYNDSHLVIEHHWMEEVKTERIIAINDAGNWVPFPATNDINRLEEFAASQGITDWRTAQMQPYEDKVAHVCVICPDLFPDQFIINGKPEVQIGTLPFLQFTCDRDLIGRNMGIVGQSIDPQKDLNYNKSKIQEMIAHQMGGGKVYNLDALENSDVDRADFESNHNDPARAWGLRAKDMAGFSTNLSQGQVNQAIINEAATATDYLDRLTIPAAMSAETQSANEPAALYEMKLKVSKLGTLTVDQRVQDLVKRMGEAYFEQAKISYRGAERTFTRKDGSKVTVLNEMIGNGVIRNKVEDIPRCSVTITASPNNLTRQQRTRAEIGTLVEGGLTAENPEAFALIMKELVRTTDMPEETKQAFEDNLEQQTCKAQIMSMAEISTAIATIQQNKVITVQMQQQLDMLMKRMGGQGQAQPQLPEQVSKAEPFEDEQFMMDQEQTEAAFI